MPASLGACDLDAVVGALVACNCGHVGSWRRGRRPGGRVALGASRGRARHDAAGQELRRRTGLRECRGRPGRGDGPPSRYRHPLEHRHAASDHPFRRWSHPTRSRAGSAHRRSVRHRVAERRARRSPFAYVPTGQLGGRRHIVVDGAPRPGTVCTLSHWPRTPTPEPLWHDVSAGIVVRALAGDGRIGDGVDAVSVDHYDADGAIALALLCVEGLAAEHGELLVEAARAGDFDVVTTPRGAQIAFALHALGDVDGASGVLGTAPPAGTDADRDGLGHGPGAGDPARIGRGPRAPSGAVGPGDGGVRGVARRAGPGVGHHRGTARAGPRRRPGGRRPPRRRSDGVGRCRPCTAPPCTRRPSASGWPRWPQGASRSATATRRGSGSRADDPGRVSISAGRRPSSPDPRRPGGRWVFDGAGAITGALHLADGAHGTLDPEDVLDVVGRHLDELDAGPAAWDPYA